MPSIYEINLFDLLPLLKKKEIRKRHFKCIFSNMQKQNRILFGAHLLRIETLSYFLVQKSQSQKSIETYLMKKKIRKKNPAENK